MSDEKPQEKPTVQMEKVPEWAVKLQEGVTCVRTDITGLRADVGLVANDVTIVKDRVTLVETRVAVLEDVRVRHSDGARQLSSNDLAHEAELAKEVAAREAIQAEVKVLREKVDAQPTKAEFTAAMNSQTKAMVDKFDEVTKNPIVRKILWLAAGAIASWLASKGHVLP